MLKKNTNDIIILLKYGDIMKRIKNQKGFTLIELLAVIIILAVIMTVAIPNIVGTLDKNKKDSFIKENNMMFINKHDDNVNVLKETLTLEKSTNTYAFVPCVYLRPDVSIISGDGSFNSPYEISIKYPMNY